MLETSQMKNEGKRVEGKKSEKEDRKHKQDSLEELSLDHK